MKRLKNKYRFVILNDNNFEEKTSFSLKGANVITFFSIIIFIIFVLIFVLFAFTPMKYYVPGYDNGVRGKKIHKMALKVDSLSEALEARKVYLKNVQNVLKGKSSDSIEVYQKSEAMEKSDGQKEKITELDKTVETDTLNINFKEENRIRKNNQLRAERTITSLERQSFFPPLEGVITEGFNEGENHFAIDVTGPEGQGIKAVKDGYVVFSGWSEETGNVIILQHQNDLLSVYKHNSELLKKNGSFVNAGEPIAIIGTSGKLSTGPHLHFELWHHGKPVNPEEYINF